MASAPLRERAEREREKEGERGRGREMDEAVLLAWWALRGGCWQGWRGAGTAGVVAQPASLRGPDREPFA